MAVIKSILLLFSLHFQNGFQSQSSARVRTDGSKRSMFGTNAFKRSHTTIAPHVARVTSHQHRSRLEVAELARQKLAIFAEPDFTNMWADCFSKVGQHEGCGLLLVAAEMDAPGTKKGGASRVTGLGDGETSLGEDEDGEDVHWEENTASRDAQRQVENLLSFASTAMVLSGLCLSISIPLSLATLDGGAIDTSDPSLGGGDGDVGPRWYAKWNESSSRHALHWAECALLALSVLNNFLCMWGKESPTVSPQSHYMYNTLNRAVDPSRLKRAPGSVTHQPF